MEQRKEQKLDNIKLDYKRLNRHMGVMLQGIDDITTLSSKEIVDITVLLNRYHVVVLKGHRKWAELEQQEFTEKLGKIELPIVYSIPPTQVKENTDSLKVTRGSGVFWHSDNSYKERPSHLSVFQMIDIPKSGTRTSFASLLNLYNNLSDNDKRTWGDYSVVYRSSVTHPLLWKHPFNGSKGVYFDIGFSTDIINNCEGGDVLPVRDSNKIFNYINDRLSNEESLLVHDWEYGDIIILDNYAVAHRADILLENEKRTLLRMTTEGIYF